MKRVLAAIYKMAFCIYSQSDWAALNAKRPGAIGGPILPMGPALPMDTRPRP